MKSPFTQPEKGRVANVNPTRATKRIVSSKSDTRKERLSSPRRQVRSHVGMGRATSSVSTPTTSKDSDGLGSMGLGSRELALLLLNALSLQHLT